MDKYKQLSEAIHIHVGLLRRYDIDFVSASTARIRLRDSYVDYDFIINKVVNYQGSSDTLDTLMTLVGERLHITYNLQVYKIIKNNITIDNEMDVNYSLILIAKKRLSQLSLYFGLTPVGTYVIGNSKIRVQDDGDIHITVDNITLCCRFKTAKLAENVDKLKKVLTSE